MLQAPFVLPLSSCLGAGGLHSYLQSPSRAACAPGVLCLPTAAQNASQGTQGFCFPGRAGILLECRVVPRSVRLHKQQEMEHLVKIIGVPLSSPWELAPAGS